MHLHANQDAGKVRRLELVIDASPPGADTENQDRIQVIPMVVIAFCQLPLHQACVSLRPAQYGQSIYDW